jgi:hypothetical protein
LLAPTDPSDGFNALAYTNGSEIVIAYQGMDFDSIDDWLISGAAATGLVPAP